MGESEAAKDFWSDPKETSFMEFNLVELAIFTADAQRALGNETVVRLVIGNEDLLDIERSRNGRVGSLGAGIQEQMGHLMKRMKGEDE